MSEELNSLIMNQAPQGDTYLYRALYHLGSMMADALRTYGQAEEEDEDEDEDGGAPGVSLPAADWSVVSVETVPFSTLQDKYQSDALWGILQFTEQPGGMFVLFDHGTAKSLTGVAANRRFGDEHLDMADEVVRRMSETFTEQWADIFSEADNQHGTFPDMPELGELQEIFMGLATNTPMAAITYRVSVPSQPMGRVMFAIPQPYLVPYSDSLRVAAENTFVQTGGEDIDARLHHLGDTPTQVVAYLGATTMTVAELQGLEEEDVIVLDQGVTDPLQVVLGGGARILAKPGTSADGMRKAVQIVRLGAD
ncbi:MAG TPA: FliM/FliN family flagellar motor switch protein [Stenomitos sp.]